MFEVKVSTLEEYSEYLSDLKESKSVEFVTNMYDRIQDGFLRRADKVKLYHVHVSEENVSIEVTSTSDNYDYNLSACLDVLGNKNSDLSIDIFNLRKEIREYYEGRGEV